MVSQDAIKQAFYAMQGQATNVVGNTAQLNNLVDELFKVLSQAAKSLGNCVGDLKTMGEMASDYTNGTYKEVPQSTIIAIVVAIIYVVSPVDLIPDFVPAIGYADDIALVAFVLDKVHGDVERYREWKEQQN